MPRRSFPRPRRRPRRTSRATIRRLAGTGRRSRGRRRHADPVPSTRSACPTPPWHGRGRRLDDARPSVAFADSRLRHRRARAFCYYVQDDASLRSATRPPAVTVDTLAPTADDRRVAVRARRTSCAARSRSRRPAPTPARASPRASLHAEASAPAPPRRDPRQPGTRPASPTAPTTSATSSTDRAGNVSTATRRPSSSTTRPRAAPSSTPAAGAFVRGATVALTTDAVDADRRHPQRAVAARRAARRAVCTTSAPPSPPRPAASRASGTPRPRRQPAPARRRRTSRARRHRQRRQRADDHDDRAVVDNTAPDVKAVLTAPPAVAGSPTLSWTPAHDAVGITRYEVLRGGDRDRHRGQHRGCADVLLQRQERARPGDVDLHRARVRRRWPLRRLQRRRRARRLHGRRARRAASPRRRPRLRAPVLTWQAPSDVRRQPLRRLPRRTAARLDAGRRRDVHGRHRDRGHARLRRARPRRRRHSRACSRPRSRWSSTRPPPTSGGAPTAQVLASGQVNLAWPAAGDALSGVAGYVVRRTARRHAAGRRRRRHRGVRAGAARLRRRLGRHRHLVVRRLRPRRRRQRRADRHGLERRRPRQDAAARTDQAHGHARRRPRRRRQSITFTLRWVKPTAQRISTASSSCSTSSARPSGPPTARPSTTASARSAKVKLRAGQNGYFAIYAYDHSGNFSREPPRKVRQARVADPAAPAQRQPRAHRPRRCSPGRPRRAARTTTCRCSVNGKRVLVGWPSKASYTHPARASSSRARTSGTSGRPSSSKAARRPSAS